MEISETLGGKIKQLRQLRQNLTQEALADILQVDRSTLASWEINRREPDVATLCRIADFFKVSVDWLVGYKPAKAALTSESSFIQENGCAYPSAEDPGWEKVIAAARQYGLEPDIVQQLIELNAKIALSLKRES
ncbi:helix-turn-helix domain-containing protein [Acetonema longum]|uniref:XRE family transcriptional regulator n=1 Tax=Acetonema longum DSM 6540 TaxID=1009370 RepID=F7NHW6_9FIRM|nr:helix-turn-helix transcriptional regulator [Acetonema longum]EGO64345.1 XRE family transcriptional regulator [Acetonema longum DSM 6540]